MTNEIPDLKTLLRAEPASVFRRYRKGILYYQAGAFLFRVPVEDTGDGTFSNSMKTTELMRWVRLEIKAQQEASEAKNATNTEQRRNGDAGQPSAVPSTLLDFTDSSVDVNKIFKSETMHGGDHRKGNRGQDRDGVENPDSRVDGKRDSAWYDEHFEKTCYLEEGNGLILRPYVSDEPDPTRVSYVDHRGQTIDWQKQKMFLPFKVSAESEWSKELDARVNATNFPGLLVKSGQYREWIVDVSNKCMPGVRTSGWDMPWQAMDGTFVNSKAYDDIAENGFEIDYFEIDPGNRDVIMQKIVSGALGDTNTRTPWIEVNGMVDTKKLFGNDFDLFKGKHSIGLYHDENILLFTLDGVISNWDFRVPTCWNYLIASQEANAHVKSETTNKSTGHDGPKRPHDSGLFGVNGYDHIDKWQEEHTIIESIGIWSAPKLPDSVIDWCLAQDTGETAEAVREARRSAGKTSVKVSAPQEEVMIETTCAPVASNRAVEKLVEENQQLTLENEKLTLELAEARKELTNASQPDIILPEATYTKPVFVFGEIDAGFTAEWDSQNVHGYNIEKDGEYWATAVTNSVVLEEAGRYTVQAVNAAGNKFSAKSEVLIVS